MSEKESKLLEIKDLSVEYRTDYGVAKAVNHLNLELEEGEAFGLVGESGSGKTTTALSILRLLPNNVGFKTGGGIKLRGQDLDKLSERKMQDMRGNAVSMIFQNPLTSLNPVFTVGEQIAMVIMKHQKCSKKEAYKKAGDMLELVGISRERLYEYPHQFSGGMRQRVGIAAGLACNPSLLIADEPTTALDVTIQLQVIELIKKLQREYKTSLLMITHNLGIISELCSKVAVMYAGSIIEVGPVDKVFLQPKHPYTVGLIGSMPKLVGERDRLVAIPGSAASANKLPAGCPFHVRCEHCTERCKTQMPEMVQLDDGRSVACHLYSNPEVKSDG